MRRPCLTSIASPQKHMPSHDTLVTGVADSNVSTLIRPAEICRASLNVPGADDPVNPALLFSRDLPCWTVVGRSTHSLLIL
jgi:hypothetical protein